MKTNFYITSLCALLVLVVTTGPVAAQSDAYVMVKAQKTTQRTQQCVGNYCPTSQQGLSGVNLLFNGVCIGNATSKSGKPGSWILTVAHAFRDGCNPTVYDSGQWYKAELYKTDFPRDLALLWVTGLTLPAVALAPDDPADESQATLHVYDYREGSNQTIPVYLEPVGAIKTSNAEHSQGILFWRWLNQVKQGYSGGAYTHLGHLVGIQAWGDSTGCVIQRESIEKFLYGSGGMPRAKMSVPQDEQPKVETKPAHDYSKEISGLRDQITDLQLEVIRLSSQERRIILKDSDGNTTGDKSYKMGQPIILRGVFKARKE